MLTLVALLALDSCGASSKPTAGVTAGAATTPAARGAVAPAAEAAARKGARGAGHGGKSIPRDPGGKSAGTTTASAGATAGNGAGAHTAEPTGGKKGDHRRGGAPGKHARRRSQGPTSGKGSSTAGGGAATGGGEGSANGSTGGDTFTVPTVYMEPTYPIGKAITYDPAKRTPARGEVVVFHLPSGAIEGSCGVHPPPGQACQVAGPGDSGSLGVGRVAALAGESIAFKEGEVVLNGHLQNEPWMKQCENPPVCNFPSALTVPVNTYYVVYDNRSELDDSRVWGALPQAAIVGVVGGS